MVMRSKSVGASCGVQLDVPTQDMGKRTRLQKVDNPQRTFTVCCGVFNQQSARHQKIPRKKNPGSAVVKCHVGWVVSGRRNSVQIYGHDLNRWKRCELRIAGAMIQMPVCMRHQEWKLFVVLIR